MLEEFPETPRPRLGLQLQALEKPPIPRIWFISDRGNEMIQVQGDRFIKNWRKEGQGEFYPRYEAVKASFERDFQVFRQFLSEHKIGDPHINQCEVSYVNHITSGEGWDSFEDFDKVFRILSLPSSQIPGRAEDARVFTRFLIPDSSGRPVGRLYVEIQPALRTSDNKRMYVLQLTARGKIGSGTEFLDLGRRWIVKAFATITTPRMHEIWKRTDRNGDI
jgi:uncharacterized protein (TIGR04255 family)